MIKKNITTFELSLRCQSVELWVRQIVQELAGGEVQEGVLETAITLRLQANTSIGHLLTSHKQEITGEENFCRSLGSRV